MSLLILSAAASATQAAPDGAWVSTAAIGAICTGLGAILSKLWPSKQKIEPNPLPIEQSSYQATMKENAKDHENLFARVSSLEKEVASIGARTDAMFEALKEQLTETKEMVREMFTRICRGDKRTDDRG